MVRNILLCTALLVAVAASSSMAYTEADLLFSVNHNALGDTGSVIDTWGIFSKTGATGYVPTVATLTDPTTGAAVKWARPAPSVLGSTGATTAGGSGLTSAITEAIPHTGFTVVSAVRHERSSLGSTDLRSIVNIFSGALALYARDDGRLTIRLQTGVNTYNTYTSTKTLTEATPTVLSMTVNTSGLYNVWAGSELFMSGTSSNWPSTLLAQNITSTSLVARNSIGLGSAGGIVTGSNSTTFRGYIGDTYVYKTLLTDAERLALIGNVETSMGMTGAVPEPGSMLALFVGLGSLVGYSRRRR